MLQIIYLLSNSRLQNLGLMCVLLCAQYATLQNNRGEKSSSDSVMVWALQACNNRLDDAIAMLDLIPVLEDELVKP